MAPFRCLLLLVAFISSVEAVCHVCSSDKLKTFNRVILYQLQNDRLQGKREWTCSELEDMGMGGGFNDQECYFAQEIAIRVCNCQPLDFQPKVEQTPVCEFCPGGDSPTRPDKLVSTNLIGDLTCQDLIAGGRGGFWTPHICQRFKDESVAEQCCPQTPTVVNLFDADFFDAECFSGFNMVQLQRYNDLPEEVHMKDLKIGDMVHIGGGKYSRVYSFGHRSENKSVNYLQIYHGNSARPLEITKEHLVFVNDRGAVPASTIVVGDNLVSADGGVSQVRFVSQVHRTGAYAPFTESGTVVVSNALASNFITINKQGEPSAFLSIGDFKIVSFHWLAHAFEAPHRMVCKLMPAICASETYNEDGISHWVSVPFKVSQWLLMDESGSSFVKTALSFATVLVCAAFYVMEMILLDTAALFFVMTGVAVFLLRNKKTSGSYKLFF